MTHDSDEGCPEPSSQEAPPSPTLPLINPATAAHFTRNDHKDRKIFVGGLTANTTNDSLYQGCSAFGEVFKAFAVRDRDTNEPKGFGFVEFVSSDSAQRAVTTRFFLIDGKMVEAKYARNDEELRGSSGSQSDVISRKVFVGGIGPGTTEVQFREFGGQFGVVVDCAIILDAEGRSRGFGFLTFDTEAAARESLKESFRTLDGRKVQLKPAKNYTRPNRSSSYGEGHHSSTAPPPPSIVQFVPYPYVPIPVPCYSNQPVPVPPSYDTGIPYSMDANGNVYVNYGIGVMQPSATIPNSRVPSPPPPHPPQVSSSSSSSSGDSLTHVRHNDDVQLLPFPSSIPTKPKDSRSQRYDTGPGQPGPGSM